MKTSLLLFIGLFAGNWGFSQSVSPEVIASGGDHFTTPTAQVSWTLGEVVTETFVAGSSQLTQGFHQTNLTITALDDVDLDIHVKIYPNPTASLVTIEFPDSPDVYQLELTDINGRTLSLKKEVIQRSELDMSRLAAGTYFLRILTTDQEAIQTYQIIKQD